MPRSAIVDEDHSELSRRIAHAFLPPYFQTPQPIAERDIDSADESGRYTFVVDIPPNFERDVLGGREPAIQLNVDATAMVQAGLGSGYAQQIITTEITISSPGRRARHAAGQSRSCGCVQSEVTTAWFTSVMGIINSVTMLAIILAGAAIDARARAWHDGSSPGHAADTVRDRDVQDLGEWLGDHRRRGLSLCSWFARLLGVPIVGSVPLFMFGVAIYCSSPPPSVYFRHDRALHAAAGFALHVDLSADEHAFRQQHAARKHAALAGDHHAGFAVDAFRVVRAGDPVSRRRLRRGLAAVPRL